MRGKPFQRGNTLAKGGKRAGAGRKPALVTLLESELFGDAAVGDAVALYTQIARDGGCYRLVPTKAKSGKLVKRWQEAGIADRLNAAKLLIERRLGRPRQSVEIKGELGLSLIDVLDEASRVLVTEKSQETLSDAVEADDR